ncbi:hypothetical protein SAMN02982919_02965 [Giesbergeria anulus]|uniref:Uncharacterized protein n=1 Tax=Giesbergeria anulus TaxID=180197 RepID=A0A1H9RTQ1_9BURK|nr:hypothetical protein SAMN02982919_02965 [Giesbergeria anulus]
MSELVEANLKFHGSRAFAYAPLKHPHSQTVCESGEMFHFVAQWKKWELPRRTDSGAMGPRGRYLPWHLHDSSIRR